MNAIVITAQIVCFAGKVPIRFQGKCKPSRCIIHFDVLGDYIYGELLIFFFINMLSLYLFSTLIHSALFNHH